MSEDQIVATIFNKLIHTDLPYMAPLQSRKPPKVSELPVSLHLDSAPISPLYLQGNMQHQTAMRQLNCGSKLRESGQYSSEILIKESFEENFIPNRSVQPMKLALQQATKKSSLARRFKAPLRSRIIGGQ